MLDIYELLFLIGSIAVPCLYLYVRSGTNSFIFVLANVGLVSLVGMAISTMESPLHYLNHSYLPSLYEANAPQELWPVFEALEGLEEYLTTINVGLMIINTLISPIIMYRYFNIFKSNGSA